MVKIIQDRWFGMFKFCGVCKNDNLIHCEAKDERTGERNTYVCKTCKNLNFK